MLGRMPVPEAMALLNRLGYDAYEMFDWRNPATLGTFVAEKGKSPLFCACLVANKGVTAPGCGLVNPRERQGFLHELEASIEAAKRMDCKQLVVLTASKVPSLSSTAPWRRWRKTWQPCAPLPTLANRGRDLRR